MIAASFGEIAACIVRVPTEIVKQRMQVGHGNLSKVAHHIYQTTGVRGFYQGFGMTCFREVIFL